MRGRVIAIMGAGNGGQALAAYAQSLGYTVRLWDRSAEKIAQLRERQTIRTYGALNVEGRPDLFTTDPEALMQGADYLFVVTSADAHATVARLIAPFVNNKMVVVLNPGRTAGALCFRETLLNCRVLELPPILETASLLFTCRLMHTGAVHILAIKQEVQMAGLPKPSGNEAYWDDFGLIYQNPALVDSTLITGLDNIGAMLHPPLMLFNAGWIEQRKVPFRFYVDGAGEHVVELIEQLDRERIRLADELSVDVLSLAEWLVHVYGTASGSLIERLHNNPAYQSIEAPTSLNHRYLLEDVPTGLAPMADIGRLLGLPCPAMDAVVSMTTRILGYDQLPSTRSLSSLGLSRASREVLLDAFSGCRNPSA